MTRITQNIGQFLTLKNAIFSGIVPVMLALKELTAARKSRILKVDTSHKREFAQYLTPIEISRFMAQLSIKHWKKTNKAAMLDPGAGSGILSYCLTNDLLSKYPAMNVSLDAWEIDNTIIPELASTLQKINACQYCYSAYPYI